MGSVRTEPDGMFRLSDIIERIAEFDDELTVYVAPEWTPKSAALVAREPDAGGLPAEASSRQLKYFLEVFVIKEVLDGLETLDNEARTARLIAYAMNDA